MEKDWRLINQKNYLYQKHLIKDYFRPEGNNDHEHCAFCWLKFGLSYQPFGYCTLDRYYWICEECFRDFRKEFEWTVDDDKVTGLPKKVITPLDEG